MSKVKPYIKNLPALVVRAERYSAEAQARVKVEVAASLDRAYTLAQSLTAVRTGKTKRSMKHELTNDGFGYKMGFDRDAGPVPRWLENGTRTMAARPMIHPTREAEFPQFRAGIIAAVESK